MPPDQASGVLFDDLGEQFLVDCAYGHARDGLEGDGCSGGWPQAYLDFVKETAAGGMQTETAYPYTGSQDACAATSEGECLSGSGSGSGTRIYGMT